MVGASFVVWAHLIWWDADTGKMLSEREFQTPSFIEHPDYCREMVLPNAKRIAMEWRKVHPNAFVNIDCEFREGSPSDPA